MTIAYPAPNNSLDIDGVYPPQHDSQLLIDCMEETELARGRRVLDLCTGSGVVAIAAAELGAASVVAFDICPRAVCCSQGNAVYAGVDVEVREGSCSGALDYAPFDLIVTNPPYVPTPPSGDTDVIPITAGPARAWDAGVDGRMVLDPLCDTAAGLLDAGGSMLLVQSALSGVEQVAGIAAVDRPRTPKSLLPRGFRSARCFRRGRAGWKSPARSSGGAGQRNWW